VPEPWVWSCRYWPLVANAGSPMGHVL